MAWWKVLPEAFARNSILRRRRKVPAARRAWSRPLNLEPMEDRVCLSTMIDAHALILPQALLDGAIISTSTAQTFDLAAGNHSLSGLYGYGGSVAFNVAGDGTVSYDPSLNGTLSGLGTSTLVVNGRTVTIDATALSLPQLNLDLQLNFANGNPLSATVLPGDQYLLAQYSYGGSVLFTVNTDGTVSYDASLQGVLTGNGTTNLGVSGRTITIDAHALSLPQLDLDYQLNFASAAPLSATVLPGDQFLFSQTVYGGQVFFSVGNDGTVSYETSLEGVLTGSGTANLNVNGAMITINATALSLPQLDLDYQIAFASAAPLSATVLPGTQFLFGATGGGGSLFFTVANNGTVNYAPVLVQTLSGQGTPNLVVLGDTVHIDATALNGVASTFTLAGIGSYPITTVPQLTLMPGWENFSTATVAFNFHVDEFSRIDYDPIYDSVASGRNTDTLMLLPPMGPDSNAPRSPTGATAPDAALPPGVETPMVPVDGSPASRGQLDTVFAMQGHSFQRISLSTPVLGNGGLAVDAGDALEQLFV